MPLSQLSSLKIHFREQGRGPEVVVFLHGNLGSSQWWERVFEFLPDRWRAIAPDLRGFGLSERPATGYRVSQFTSDLADLVHQLNLHEFALVSHSLGGAVALQYALDYPKKVWALTLVDPVPAEGLRFGPEVFERLARMRSSPKAMREGLKALAPGAPDDEFFARLAEESLHAAGAAFDEILGSVESFDVSRRLAELSMPVLCIMGELDSLISRDAVERMRRSIPDCRLETMKEVGHCPHIEAPRRLTELMIHFHARRRC